MKQGIKPRTGREIKVLSIFFIQSPRSGPTALLFFDYTWELYGGNIEQQCILWEMEDGSLPCLHGVFAVARWGTAVPPMSVLADSV